MDASSTLFCFCLDYCLHLESHQLTQQITLERLPLGFDLCPIMCVCVNFSTDIWKVA